MKLRRIAAAPLLWAIAASCGASAEAAFLEFLSCSDLSDMSVAPVPEIRMLVLYSQRASDAATAKGIEAEIEHAVLEANAVMSWSGIPLRVALAHMELLPGVTDNVGSAQSHRVALTAGTGVYAKAHELRETWHADVVVLVTISDGGNAEPVLKPGMGASTSAFLVADREGMGQQFTLTHELGHLLGGTHGRALDPSNFSVYPYAFPKGTAADAWHTMMATGGTRIEHFSNPDVLYFVDPDDPDEIGEPTGTPVTDALPADNRRTLTNTGPMVAAYRLTYSWFASSAATTPWFEKRVGDELMTEVRFADLNGDRETDAFKIGSDGAWLVSYGATGPWQTFRAADPLGAPLAKLRFADFVGDGADDVFYVDGATNKWVAYRSGAADWEDLNTDASIAGIAVEDLAFGEFDDAESKSDVFRADETDGTWYVSRNGSNAFTVLRAADAAFKQPLKELRLGDFDGDGITDVFRSDTPPTKTWHWSRSGTAASWAALLIDDAAGFPVSDLLFGDFDGDGATDVLRPDGHFWYLSLRGQAVPVAHRISCVMPNNMALGDFDGDGTTDVIRMGMRP